MVTWGVLVNKAAWSRWTRIAASCLSAAAMLGCGAFSPPLTCPQRGGPDWIRVESEHFTLSTDMSEPDALERLGQFEQSFQVLSELAFPSKDPPTGRTEVVVFSYLEDYEQVAPPRTAGFFSLFDLDRHPRIVMHGPYSDVARQIFQHELTHRFVRHFMPRAPSWLNEGLAEFYETLHMEGEHVVIGGASSKRRFENDTLVVRTPLGLVTVAKLPSATELLNSSPTAFRDPQLASAFYAGSWLFVSMLLHGPERYERPFWSFVDRLTDGRPAEAAWRDSFASLPRGEMDQALARFVQQGEIVVERRRFASRPASFTAPMSLSDAAIHTLWAQLRLNADVGGVQAAEKELAEAFAQSPGFAEAHHWSGLIALERRRYDEAEAHFRDALELQPHEERYLQGLCTSIYTHEMARPAHQRALTRLEEPMQRLAKVARSASALNTLGWYYALLDRPEEGWPFAKRSVQLEPSCAECLDTLALLTFKQGRPHDALELQRWALAIMPEVASVQGVIERLRQYERAVAAAGPR